MKVVIRDLAVRSTPEEIAVRQERVRELLQHHEIIRNVLDALANMMLILDRNRQAVFANKGFLDFLGEKDAQRIQGLRPGEIVRCEHSRECAAGCGNTDVCRVCGALGAILSSLDGERSYRECRITTWPDGEALDLAVISSPLMLYDEPYAIMVFSDMSHEKRRAALEHIFFHDVLNTAAILSSMTSLACNVGPEQTQELVRRIQGVTVRLIDEILAQRTLLEAEQHELILDPKEIGTLLLLRQVVLAMEGHSLAQKRKIEIDTASDEVTITSDESLLYRVLVNLIKNALEASHEGEVVTIGCKREGQGVCFWVRNAAVMEEEVKLQVFQRSFSTKGIGRGLGCYSSKLLTERYLKGSLHFDSSADLGTIFEVHLPEKL